MPCCAGPGPSSSPKKTELAKATPKNPLGLVPLVAGWWQQLQFSQEREHDIIGRHQQGEPLPADVRHKLKRRYFHRSARDLPRGW
ncbi:MAG: hypothetical protein ACRYFX_17140 [Janthinobacterium lividum]